MQELVRRKILHKRRGDLHSNKLCGYGKHSRQLWGCFPICENWCKKAEYLRGRCPNISLCGKKELREVEENLGEYEMDSLCNISLFKTQSYAFKMEIFHFFYFNLILFSNSFPPLLHAGWKSNWTSWHVNEWADNWMNEWKCEWISGQMIEWTSERMHGQAVM